MKQLLISQSWIVFMLNLIGKYYFKCVILYLIILYFICIIKFTDQSINLYLSFPMGAVYLISCGNEEIYCNLIIEWEGDSIKVNVKLLVLIKFIDFTKIESSFQKLIYVEIINSNANLNANANE